MDFHAQGYMFEPWQQIIKNLLTQFWTNKIFFLHIILSYENSTNYEHFWFFQVVQLWQSVTLQPLEAQGHVLHFWIPPIYICLEPDCQGDCSVIKVCQVMLKSWGLLNKLLYASDLNWAPLYFLDTQIYSLSIPLPNGGLDIHCSSTQLCLLQKQF